MFDLQPLGLGVVDFSGQGRQSFSYVPIIPIPNKTQATRAKDGAGEGGAVRARAERRPSVGLSRRNDPD